jgi:pimeloyl-ACP methyl ester carboxylesterase
MTTFAPMASAVPYIEHRISHDGHMIYARDYPGQGPAYVMLHGFPDNLHIYDYVVPWIWGVLDPYLTPDAAAAIASIYPHAAVKPVQAGHWLMIDAPEEVAKLLLAGV